MDTLYKILNKMKKRDLIWISKYLKIYFNNSDTKYILINKLLNPLSKKYKMKNKKKRPKITPPQIPSESFTTNDPINMEEIKTIFESSIETSKQKLKLPGTFESVEDCYEYETYLSEHSRDGYTNTVVKYKGKDKDKKIIKFVIPGEGLYLTKDIIKRFIKEINIHIEARNFANKYEEIGEIEEIKIKIKIPEIFKWGICKKDNKYVLFVEMEKLVLGKNKCLNSEIKEQLNEFLKNLRIKTGIVHRDLHFGNIYYNDGKDKKKPKEYIAIIDWGESEILKGESKKYEDLVQQNQMENNIKECPKETTP